MGVGRTAGSLPNSTVGGVSVLDVWAGDSPLPRFCPFPLGLTSAQNTSQRARGEGRGRATKSRVFGRSGAQRRRGVGGNTRFGSGSRGTSGQSSFKPLKPPVCNKKGKKEKRKTLRENTMLYSHTEMSWLELYLCSLMPFSLAVAPDY